jgi:Glycosyl hydrolase family 1
VVTSHPKAEVRSAGIDDCHELDCRQLDIHDAHFSQVEDQAPLALHELKGKLPTCGNGRFLLSPSPPAGQYLSNLQGPFSAIMTLKPIYVLLTLGYYLQSVLGQQVYIPASGPTTRPQCTTAPPSQPAYAFSSFSFTQTETTRTATSVAAPTASTTYAPPYASLSSLVPSLSTTTWGKWDPNATVSATDTDNPYGNAAWTALWERANPPNFTYTSLYSTTVSPTPVPTSELILPPADYFGPTDCYNFPKDFVFGVSGSAAQIEGAIADQGRSPTLMELLVQDARPKDYVTNENYYYYKQDIERLAAMGVKYYSFTIPWARVLPFTLAGTPVNQQAIDHYNDVIDYVLAKGMIPTATMIHFDSPLAFYGNLSTVSDRVRIGYVNGAYQNETFEDAFVNYGKIVLTHFADRVPVWFR